MRNSTDGKFRDMGSVLKTSRIVRILTSSLQKVLTNNIIGKAPGRADDTGFKMLANGAGYITEVRLFF